ncbi:MAG: NAD(P)-dependent glycerol-3-phosphate dehydrogenase [Firmicutes bacterium]|nr:NAD(P)-dependent glycerol-3-phosphate dehydrogenase [Bacillota bacterium]
MDPQVAVIGAGGWGTALSCLLAQRFRQVTLWARRPDFAEELRQGRVNSVYLPGVRIPPQVRITADVEEALAGAWVVVLAVPAQHLRSVVRMLLPVLRKKGAGAAVAQTGTPPYFVNVAKGLERKTMLRMSQVLASELPAAWHGHIASLSGPNHAEEVGRFLPAAAVIGSPSAETAAILQHLFSTPRFRVYTTSDLAGVEYGGALKNVIALAAGISDGLQLGDNTRAALMTRGLAEMARLGLRLGARPETFAGLSGMGDLIVTCTSTHSRNARTGRAIGAGKRLEEVLAGTPMVVEGVETARAARELAARVGVEVPITEVVCRILFEGLPPSEGVGQLMERRFTQEAERNDWRS